MNLATRHQRCCLYAILITLFVTSCRNQPSQLLSEAVEPTTAFSEACGRLMMRESALPAGGWWLRPNQDNTNPQISAARAIKVDFGELMFLEPWAQSYSGLDACIAFEPDSVKEQSGATTITAIGLYWINEQGEAPEKKCGKYSLNPASSSANAGSPTSGLESDVDRAPPGSVIYLQDNGSEHALSLPDTVRWPPSLPNRYEAGICAYFHVETTSTAHETMQFAGITPHRPAPPLPPQPQEGITSTHPAPPLPPQPQEVDTTLPEMCGRLVHRPAIHATPGYWLRRDSDHTAFKVSFADSSLAPLAEGSSANVCVRYTDPAEGTWQNHIIVHEVRLTD